MLIIYIPFFMFYYKFCFVFFFFWVEFCVENVKAQQEILFFFGGVGGIMLRAIVCLAFGSIVVDFDIYGK